jgi:hypothetical protein
MSCSQKTRDRERKFFFGRTRQEDSLPSVVRRFSPLYVAWSSFSEIDSSIVLLVRQADARRRACQPEHAVKRQQINTEKTRERESKKGREHAWSVHSSFGIFINNDKVTEKKKEKIS